MFRPVIWAVTGLLSACLACAAPARATTVTPDLEFIQLPSVSGSWQTVTLTNSYSSPVVVCTYNLPSKSSPPALVRVRSAAAGSFQVKLQRFENSSMVTAAPVHCIIADEGVYTLPNGLKFEAHKVLSDGTSGQNAANGWNLSATEEVTSTLGHTYSSPVVLGQVMTENDARASVFWMQNCAARGSAPLTNGRLCVGKHIGQLSGSRANETLGYIVAEGGSGTVNGVQYTLAPGGNSIAGVGNSPPYSYTVSGDYDVGVATQLAENGGNGGWAVLYGSDPLPANRVYLAIEEDGYTGDLTRSHVNEEVAYWLFKIPPLPVMQVAKSSSVVASNPFKHRIPGNLMEYTISVTNTGNASPDANSVFVFDKLPAEVSFYNGDVGTPGSGPVVFSDAGSGLTFSAGTDLAFSNASTPPASMADCSYSPASGMDDTVTYICARPQGTMNQGSSGTSQFDLRFRVMVD